MDNTIKKVYGKSVNSGEESGWIEKAVRSLYSDKENAEIDALLEEITEEKPNIKIAPTE